MSKNNGGFNVPWGLIIFAYIFFWPLGLILTFLKIFSSPSSNNKKNINQNNKNIYSQKYQNYHQYYENRSKEWDWKNQASQNQQYSNPNTQQNNAGNQYSGQAYNTNTSSGYQYTSSKNINQQNYQTASDNFTQNKDTKNDKKSGKKSKKRAIKSRTWLLILGICLIALGSIIGFDAVSSMLSYGYSGGLLYDFFQGAFIAGGGLVSLVMRWFLKKRDSIQQRYITVVGDRSVISISKIASIMNISEKKACKDLQEMIDNGMFGEDAFIDIKSRTLVMSMDSLDEIPDIENIVNDDYDTTLFNSKQAKKFDRDNKAQDSSSESDNNETDDDNDEFHILLKKIRAADDAIADDEVSRKIRRIEEVTRSIFEHVDQKPEKLSQIRSFMNYYLPTTLKLLDSYSQIEKLGVEGENIYSARTNIEKILDMLVIGFENQLDKLYKSEEMDISSDINVLEQMMYKDGLATNSQYDMFTPDDEIDFSNTGSSSFAVDPNEDTDKK